MMYGDAISTIGGDVPFGHFLKKCAFDGSRYEKPVGYLALIQHFSLLCAHHSRFSLLSPEPSPSNSYSSGIDWYLIPKDTIKGNPEDPLWNLFWAAENEGINLCILEALFKESSFPLDLFQKMIDRREGAHCRLWFVYEFLSGKRLEIEDLNKSDCDCDCVPLLDPKVYKTSTGTVVPRQGILNNLLGNRHFCPLIRQTSEKSTQTVSYNILNKYIGDLHPSLFLTADTLLMEEDITSSWDIEQETITYAHREVLVKLFEKYMEGEALTKEMLLELASKITESDVTGYREHQNCVGDTLFGISYLPPSPDQVPILMDALLEVTQNLLKDEQVEALTIASIVSYGFYLIHPFSDGNGIIHRFLIHYVLKQRQFYTLDLIVPLCRAILESRSRYFSILNAIDITPLLSYQVSLDTREVTVTTQNTGRLYQFVDMTDWELFVQYVLDVAIISHFKKVVTNK
eukprot:TRINITY_DN11335_c0_g1_i1.p1 TRINITY_DN11335_c0_g1~~TRINITY_DN11335_c0_g1_i1.p1  ORF type:complete len:458 (-),score=109.77 TRINITY_DN11335_c0_g1_i1:24-1397(-)